MGEVFRYAWRDRNYFETDVWLALGQDGDGWWLDAFFHGRHPVAGGAKAVEAFAHALLRPRGDRRYEEVFELVKDSLDGTINGQNSHGAITRWETTTDLDVTLDRERDGGPETLTIASIGFIVGTRFGFQTGAELVDEPVDRPRLETQARRLLHAVGSAEEPPTATSTTPSLGNNLTS
ncbi:hypothetical protein AB0873_31555 [Micromonospora sp. NPDC047707]|uniref:hypothetical protein n=1 Tax=Micromonospora sp. NPDC047707 TaxID=3154498 RepID=UPI0034560368